MHSDSHPNRLAAETSPYLLQHADNPVDWYPWGDEALDRAAREGKPILLSVGYSACHWCHVMERTSPSRTRTSAALMNRHFVNIKVDREERPDVDEIYMSGALQAMLTDQQRWLAADRCSSPPDLRPGSSAAPTSPRRQTRYRVAVRIPGSNARGLWKAHLLRDRRGTEPRRGQGRRAATGACKTRNYSWLDPRLERNDGHSWTCQAVVDDSRWNSGAIDFRGRTPEGSERLPSSRQLAAKLQ